MKKLIISLVNLILGIFGKRLVYLEGKYIIEKNIFFNELIVWKRFFTRNSQLTIFDVGAHVGGSVKFYKKNFPLAKVHSFEPAKDSFKILSKNYEGNDDVYITHAAVSDKNGEVTLNIFSEECTGNSIENATDKGKIKNQINIPCLTLDQYIRDNNINSIDILKLDTQGHELECLQGGRESLEKRIIKSIKCEVMLHNYYDKKCSISQIETLLNGFGYVTYDICSIKKSSHYARTLLIDLIFISKDIL